MDAALRAALESNCPRDGWAATPGGLGRRTGGRAGRKRCGCPHKPEHSQRRGMAASGANFRALRPSGMPTVVAGKTHAKSRGPRRDFRPKPRPGEKRGPHIDRHPMGRCRCFLSQIVDGYADDDIRHCGGPIGSKLRQKRRSQVFSWFLAVSRREGIRLLPRFRHCVARLPATTT